MRWLLRFLIPLFLFAGCEQVDGDLLYARIADSQPDDPHYGRLLSVFASANEGGDLEVRVSGGQLRSAIDFTLQASFCTEVSADCLIEEKIAVEPAEAEALLVAVLRKAPEGGGADCSGTPRTQIIVPVQRVGDAPAMDASPTDAAVDSGVD